MHWFDYSILRYCPNSIRGEIVNIGLVVFRQSGIDTRIINNSMKIKILDDTSELDDLVNFETAARKLCSFAETPNEQFLMLKSISGAIRVSDRNSFSIQDISEYSKKVDRLYVDLVKPYSLRQRQISTSRLHTRIRQEFSKLEILGKEKADIDNHKVIANYEINDKSGITADFMLKNGKFHMTEVIDFNVNDTNQKLKETSLKMMSFMEGQRHIANDIGRYLVYAASKEKIKDVSNHISLAEDYSDLMFNFDSTTEKAKYYQLMRELSGGVLKLSD